ncbi:MAG: hypothetical protein AAB425_14395 [Bdellovibrionota bacterium]
MFQGWVLPAIAFSFYVLGKLLHPVSGDPDTVYMACAGAPRY